MDARWGRQWRPTAASRRELLVPQEAGSRVDAQTAELRERIAAASRTTLLGVLLHRR
jgi:hypothetical protein